jgi:FixJ family two-component response regulator
MLLSAGYQPEPFGSASQFMESYKPDAEGCLVLDLSMPDVTGLDLQRWLAQTKSSLPVIFLTGRGDIPTGVRAMKEGAVDFLTKPVDSADLLRSIEEALRRERQMRAARAEEEETGRKLATLTPREHEVLKHVISGRLNKQIAAELGTVEKTIKVHRARVMRKMGAQSLAELVRMAERIGIGAMSRDPSCRE